MTTLLDLFAGRSLDPIGVSLAIGCVALYRWIVVWRGAEIARNLSEAYRPEGVP